MADKDLLEIIADMLRKLDQHSETLEIQNKALTSFMEGTLKQFDQQQIFNERLFKMNDKLIERLEILENKK
ncbi:MAG: hypothetical protein V5804_02775 [Mucilaginibacter sp.]|uniref:hypothetical protein n=1 Tax=Mucilaginibacter sp. TaxID=1882438 RepID=UPI0034E465DF